MTQTRNTERVIDVADIEPRFRHSMIGQLLKHLEPEHSLQIVVDHDPQRLRFYLDLCCPTAVRLVYLNRKPDARRPVAATLAGDTAVLSDAMSCMDRTAAPRLSTKSPSAPALPRR